MCSVGQCTVGKGFEIIFGNDSIIKEHKTMGMEGVGLAIYVSRLVNGSGERGGALLGAGDVSKAECSALTALDLSTHVSMNKADAGVRHRGFTGINERVELICL
ncbi:hypothetical protein E2C01_031479 [Portunus trituberculatus]|uniref:Uncharacterized protein n=1 Tax=Portunus trituberculatus TaxID=210409 RepID=A0A5B7EYP0_PORTR|nr:hypothetical protein [Portunus trituberculatus]